MRELNGRPAAVDYYGWRQALSQTIDTDKTGRPNADFPLTREEVETCADWAVGKFADNKDYLSADNTVESELPLDTDLYKNGLTKDFIEQVLKKVTDKQKLTRTNRLAVKIAYVDPDEEYNGLTGPVSGRGGSVRL